MSEITERKDLTAVVTYLARTKLAEARAGVRTLPKISGMAFGDGVQEYVDPETGKKRVPEASETQTELVNEIYRKELDAEKPWEKITDTKYRYFTTLEWNELQDAEITELALYDSEGDLICIRNCKPKGKDADLEMIFEVDYES